MLIRMLGLIVPLLILSLTGAASGVTPSFRGLGQPPVPGTTVAKAISGDGRFVVLDVDTCDPGEFFCSQYGYRWSHAARFEELDDGAFLEDVSKDGSVVIGWGPPWTNRWMASGWVDVTGGSGEFFQPLGLSAQGDVIVGEWEEELDDVPFRLFHPVRWSSTTGLQLLEPDEEGEASAVSADGSIAVGYVGPPEGPVFATRWLTGQPAQNLGTLSPSNPLTASRALAVSPDGGTVVGWSDSFGLQAVEAFHWNEGEGMVGLGLLQGKHTMATSVSDGGQVVVGFAANDLGEPEDAFVWTQQEGMVALDHLLAGVGTPVQGWTLLEAVDVSFNGTTMVGNGINPSGQSEAWIAVVPEPSAAVSGAVGVAVVALLGVRNRRRRAGATAWETLRRGDRPPQSRFSSPAR